MRIERGSPDDYMECDACASKPGSPTLCPACLHNRTLVSRLRAEVKEATTPLKMLLWCPECGERHIDEGTNGTNGIDWNHAIKAIAVAEGRDPNDVVKDMFVAYVTAAQ